MRFLLVALILICSTARPENVTLGWDALSGVAGYFVYDGVKSRTYTNLVNAGKNNFVTVSNLVPGTVYFFAATSYTASGLESDFSAELSYLVPTNSSSTNLPLARPPPVTGIVIKGKKH
jgi:hypothetical protein